MKYKTLGLCAFTLGLINTSVLAQQRNNFNSTITTAVPFLQVAADARAGGLGDQGVATSADVFSQQWNSSKYAFAEKEIGVGVNITPYLTKLVDDIILANLVGYKKLDERSAVAASFRYFSLGEIQLRNGSGDELGVEKPNSLAIDVSYALKLSERFSMSVAGRYIRDDLRLQSTDANAEAGNSFGVDISGYYQSENIPYRNFDGRWRGGFAITNIGPKISYSEGQESFIPTNIRVGGGFDFGIDTYNTVKTTLEFSKLLVPTPDPNDPNPQQTINDASAIGSIFSSLNDAPDGIREEIAEITTAFGVEYDYNDVFALRAGYFHEFESKGARQFVSLGAGFKYTSIGVDLSYLFNTSDIPSPLDGTLRVGLTFSFGQDYNEF